MISVYQETNLPVSQALASKFYLVWSCRQVVGLMLTEVEIGLKAQMRKMVATERKSSTLVVHPEAPHLLLPSEESMTFV